MSESCNSRHFSWLMKSCFPTTQQDHPHQPQPLPHHPSADNHHQGHRQTTISALPDDVLLECLSRVPPSSLPSISLVCRRWSRLLHSPAFSLLRRRLGLLRLTVFAIAASDCGLLAAYQRLGEDEYWKLNFFPARDDPVLAHARVVPVGRRIYIIGRNVMVRYDTWTGMVIEKSAMVFPRKKFAAAVVDGKIYVAGGAARTAAVEVYDPEKDEWRVVADAPRRRYGCIGAAVDGVFYVIGGLKIGASGNQMPRAAGAEAHIYASSMDLYDVETRGWLRSRGVPGGGCVVAACAAGGHVFVLASHAVELSFWRFNARRSSATGEGGGSGGGGGFGEWCRIKSPPLPAQVRVDSSVRFSCVGVGDMVVLVQVVGSVDDLLRRSGRSVRGSKDGLVLVYDTSAGEWSRGVDLPEVMRRAACVCVEC